MFLDGWIRRAEASGIRIPSRWARHGGEPHGLRRIRRDDLERPTGGDQQQDQDDEAQAYGFRDMEFFKLKILAIHETRYELVG